MCDELHGTTCSTSCGPRRLKSSPMESEITEMEIKIHFLTKPLEKIKKPPQNESSSCNSFFKVMVPLILITIPLFSYKLVFS